jgi:hypothetical protein
MAKRSKKKFPITEAAPDDPIFSNKFVVGGRVRRASPASPSKRKFKTTPAPPDHRIYSSGFVLGGRVHKASPKTSSKPAQSRGRGLPHQYPWIDCADDIRLSDSSEDDEDA